MPPSPVSSMPSRSDARPRNLAHSTGHTSTTGRSQMTMPPEWMPRWRGARSTSRARSSTAAGMSWPSRSADVDGHRRPHVDLLGPGVLLARRVAERLGHVAHRRPGPVGDDVGHLGRVAPAVALVDVLDGLLPASALDVDVDVGRAVALGRQEPLEQQAERHGVGVGDAERVADRRVGGAAPPLAVDVGLAAEADDVPHHQEEPGNPSASMIASSWSICAHAFRLAAPSPAGVDAAPRPVAVGSPPPRPAAAGSPSRRARRDRGTAGAGAPPAPGRTRTPGPARPPGPRPPASGRTAGPARRPTAGGRRPPPGASRRGRRGCGGPGPRPARWPAGAGRAWRSGRCWWPPRRPPRAPPGRPGRRCGSSRAGRRGRTARPPRCRPRTGRPAPPAGGPRRPAPPSARARGTAPLRQPVSTSQWPPWAADQSTTE